MSTPNVRPLAAGNWKMNGSSEMTLSLLKGLTERLKSAGGSLAAEILVCPPFPYLAAAIALVDKDIAVGGQDCHPKASGAHTGDVAAAMLADIGCRYVILGHSERRTDHGESSAEVAAKAAAALVAKLTAIICVGETEAERDRGEALKIVEKQIVESLPPAGSASNLVIAYEPVWAIGTGRTPTSDDVAAVHGHIRKLLRTNLADGGQVRILYGGSVKPANAAELMAIPDVNGALVGGASLKAEDFWAIAEACR
ncbi:triose-phosphate isomerase [Dongia soli]|uniref:Triosephosphate isomerase n=1 Tax=Dongia soli TaxID=600628 RepID=A0ABU5EA33_9PROT|nr:triose-phosphate isomerase [Dongia soli]MDY0883058.1 triose-phosphate isomerase [Dongia soli]